MKGVDSIEKFVYILARASECQKSESEVLIWKKFHSFWVSEWQCVHILWRQFWVTVHVCSYSVVMMALCLSILLNNCECMQWAA